MITADELKASALAIGKPVAWVAFTMVDPKPWALSYMAWVQARWDEVRAELGISHEDLPSLPGALFGEQFVERCAATVRKHYGVSS